MHPNTTNPTPEDIAELTAFLPGLYGQRMNAVSGEESARPDRIGIVSEGYSPTVRAFFKAVSKPCWLVHSYDPAAERKHLFDQSFVSRASLDEIKAMLTFCSRSERFIEGAHEVLIGQGHIRRLLERLQSLQHR